MFETGIYKILDEHYQLVFVSKQDLINCYAGTVNTGYTAGKHQFNKDQLFVVLHTEEANLGRDTIGRIYQVLYPHIGIGWQVYNSLVITYWKKIG